MVTVDTPFFHCAPLSQASIQNTTIKETLEVVLPCLTMHEILQHFFVPCVPHGQLSDQKVVQI
jgi:hypothetical protein